MSAAIYISRDGRTSGPFDKPQLKERLRVGEFSPEDLAWYQGADGWQPIKLLPIFAPPPSAAPQPPRAAVPPVNPPAGATGRIRCISGPDLGKQVDLSTTQVTFGRAVDAGILSDDPDVESRHLILSTLDGSLQMTRISQAAVVVVNGISLGDSGVLHANQQFRAGRSVWEFEKLTASGAEPRLIGGLRDTISQLAGVEKIQGFSFSKTFSQVFQRHRDEEIESFLASGTLAATPAIAQIDPSFPQPWMFFRAMLLSVVAFVVLVFSWNHFENPFLIPGVIATGALAMPISVLVLFLEANKPQNVSIYIILKLLVIGGAWSLLFTHVLWPHLDGFFAKGLGLKLGASVAGLIEEPAKALVLLWVVNNKRYPWTLNGLLFGAAVGTGFAIFESAGYALWPFLGGIAQSVSTGNGQWMTAGQDALQHSLLIRGIMTPLGGHGLLTAVIGAGIWRAKQGGNFRWDILSSGKFLRPFIAAVTVHMVWNAGFILPPFGYGIYLVCGFVMWVVIIGLIQEGLREIAVAKKAHASVLTGGFSASLN